MIFTDLHYAYACTHYHERCISTCTHVVRRDNKCRPRFSQSKHYMVTTTNIFTSITIHKNTAYAWSFVISTTIRVENGEGGLMYILLLTKYSGCHTKTPQTYHHTQIKNLDIKFQASSNMFTVGSIWYSFLPALDSPFLLPPSAILG